MRTIDYSSPHGAHALAAKIRAYWRKKGHDLEVEVVERSRARGERWFGITSGLVNGLPPKGAKP
jgi:hypothetical protein